MPKVVSAWAVGCQSQRGPAAEVKLSLLPSSYRLKSGKTYILQSDTSFPELDVIPLLQGFVPVPYSPYTPSSQTSWEAAVWHGL